MVPVLQRVESDARGWRIIQNAEKILIAMSLISGRPGAGLRGAAARTAVEGLEGIGRAGAGRGVREVVGGADDAKALFGELTQGAKVRPHPNVEGGLLAELPAGGTVGYRPFSRSGPATVDVTVEGVNVRKIKFVEK